MPGECQRYGDESSAGVVTASVQSTRIQRTFSSATYRAALDLANYCGEFGVASYWRMRAEGGQQVLTAGGRVTLVISF